VKKWTGLAFICLIVLIASSALYAGTDENKSVSFGVNSSSGGYVTQVNNRGTYNYARVMSVAPIVNRIKVMNSSNNNIIYDGCPAAGATFYMPQGSYVVTGWSSYGTEDRNGVVISFAQAAPAPAATPSTTASPSTSGQVTVDGQPLQPAQNGTTVYTDSPGSYSNPYYNTGIYLNGGVPYGGIYVGPGYGVPGQCNGLIYCSLCGRYHRYGGCAFTMPNRSVLTPYNPYWRGTNCNNYNYNTGTDR